MKVENSKGECNLGQHEVNFHYGDALSAADEHAVYKMGAKEIASQEEMAITFMAKYNEAEGNSCHIHFSLGKEGGGNAFADDEQLFDRFLAGQLDCLRELSLFYAPNVNSYKRFAKGSFAPTAVAWGNDNRTCSLRVVGHGQAKRFENRLPGADVNPYLAIEAMIASGLHGMDNELELESLSPATPTSRASRRPDQHLRRARPVRREQGRPRGVRRRGGRPLSEPRPGRDRLRRISRHRLGQVQELREAVSGPAVGICTAIELASWTVWREVAVTMAPRSYAAAVQRAGALALLLPPDEAAVADPEPLLSGRRPVAGGRLGHRPGAPTGPSPTRRRRARGPSETPSRWRWPAAAVERGMPVLGICRGMQALNVALGGTLVQHLDEPLHLHTWGAFSDHDVRLEPGSLAARATGAEHLSVRSHHHQGLDRLGEGLRATGWSEPDELVEAVELPERDEFALGVLWHPEEDTKSAVIGSLVEAARTGVAS